MTRPRKSTPEQLEAVDEVLGRHREVFEHGGQQRRLGVRGPAGAPRHEGDVVTAENRCVTCGTPVESVNTEPLDYDQHDESEFTAISLVIILLPCGHSFTKDVGHGR